MGLPHFSLRLLHEDRPCLTRHISSLLVEAILPLPPSLCVHHVTLPDLLTKGQSTVDLDDASPLDAMPCLRGPDA